MNWLSRIALYEMRKFLMNSQGNVSDRRARMRALDPLTSFIVQAPAGSGKTGLLMQRFLVLLARVEMPEEIVAITFTRKAASEMRQRIMQALEAASSGQVPEMDHGLHTWELARKALVRDAEKGWQLLENPGRLRIQTIDSFCMALVRQMPMLSRFGSVPAITENAERLYLEAARNTVLELESGSEWSDAVVHLARCLDNRLDRLQGLISTMLGRRDQWLRKIANPNDPKLERQTLEGAIAHLITDTLRGPAKLFPRHLIMELVSMAGFAARHLPSGSSSPIASCRDLTGLPKPSLRNRRQWEGIVELLLTKDGHWRARVNKKQGFPSPSDAGEKSEKEYFRTMKQRMEELLVSLRSEEVLREQLALLLMLPPRGYMDLDWTTLKALARLLGVAAAHLEIVFRERGQVDFTSLIQAATTALGDAEAPTDLALALDHRIQHLLVDEFQDTSYSQYNLLGKLTAGWQPGDGRTLFVVGDPMQSIYRFREAEVGLFLVAKKRGIGHVPLKFLQLEVNFRSQKGVIDWINERFKAVLPECDSFNEGAVSFSKSVSFHPSLEAEAVTVCPSLGRDDVSEARKVVSIIEQARAGSPGGTIAILVRARSHLLEIARQLQKAGHRFQAVDIESLAHRPIIQDLMALTRALSYRHDRIAWLAVLRAPYCGLSLADLLILAGDEMGQTMIDSLRQEWSAERLSEDGQRRIGRVLPVLETALSEQSRSSLRNIVEGTWIALGGPACLVDSTELENAEVFFQLLEKIDSERDVAGISELDREVEKLFALPDTKADDAVQLMTIHKAKGLEFDTVILPGLGRAPRHEDEKLLYWLENVRKSGDSDLLLAPISAEGEQKGPLTAYLQHLDRIKGKFEDARLLYVAATRAKQRLYLMGHAVIHRQGDSRTRLRPLRNSLLECLWPAVEDRFKSRHEQPQDIEARIPEKETGLANSTYTRTRLALDWSLLAPARPIQVPGTAVEEYTDERKPIKFEWAGETARHIGTVVHRLLQHIGVKGVEHIGSSELHRLEQTGYKLLMRLALPNDQLESAYKVVCTALRSTLEDERGRWILSGMHENAGTELALSSIGDSGVYSIVIDRTFVDEQGTRWIIDYKASTHRGKKDEFLDQEKQRYSEQLERYANVMRKTEGNPIRLGLYFPLLNGWREWPFSAESACDPA